VAGTGVEFLREQRVGWLAQYYPKGFEKYAPFGFAGLQGLRTKVVWSEQVRARNMRSLLLSGSWQETTYPYEIRKIDWPDP